ncbi:hypothetical protein ABT224_21355 [Streptomyces sp. NPDC001584]|uniref:hypothetical protein n=1 Tax=Streptomyces sp. NPDC001584 TaxID=3154521 RepID=UPI00331950F5
MQPFPSVEIPANELRPGRHWYATATAIAVLLIVVGAAIGVYRFNSAIDSVDTGHQFANGDTVTLRLEPGSEKAISIGDSGGFFAFAGWLILAVALPVLGIGICAVIVLVTAFRRGRHRRRLLAGDPSAGPVAHL